jgi:deoxyuridine 5'-triphosphate nucleotidohydrolase
MKYTKTRLVTDPQRANPGDAGIDFYIPQFTKPFISALMDRNKGNAVYLFYEVDWAKYFDVDLHEMVPFKELTIVLMPHHRILIPSGIHVKLEPGTMMDAKNKSGVAHKMGLDIMAQLVDESYQGEVHLSINNTSAHPVILKQGMKLVQFVISKYENSELMGVSDLGKLYGELKTERGAGGFGSSNI